MDSLNRFFHRLRSRHFERRASVLRRDLADYILTEQTRIVILSQHAAWHATRASAPTRPLRDHGIWTLPSVIEVKGHSGRPDSIGGNSAAKKSHPSDPI